MLSDQIKQEKTLADFADKVPDHDQEVVIYDAEGDVKHYWRGRVYGGFAVFTVRKPGKAEKLLSIEEPSCSRHDDIAYYAKRMVEVAAEEKAKRTPIIRKEKAYAKLKKLIEESKTDLRRFVCWAKYANNCVLFDTPEEIESRHGSWDMLSKTEDEQVAFVMEACRKIGDNYFKGLIFARKYIDQLKPGGLGEQTLNGVIEMVEKSLVPWPYVAGYLRKKVMDSQKPALLAGALIEKHTHIPSDGHGFYADGTTAEGLVKQVAGAFRDVKPDVLDALTLD